MAKELRKFIFEKYCLHSIVDLSYVKVFEDVSTYVVISQIQNKIPDKKFEIQVSYKTKESDILNYLKTLNVDI